MSQIIVFNDPNHFRSHSPTCLNSRSIAMRLGGKAFVAALIWLSAISDVQAEVDENSPRVTPLVKVIRRIEPSIVALFTPTGNQLVSGSGLIIHGDGYILTNNHVLPRPEGFALIGERKPIPFRVMARVPESDIAVLKLVDPPPDLPAMKFGHSSDLMNGETVVVAGNPGGRGIVFTAGIVSAKSVLEGGPNALVMSNYENDRRDRFIQFDAASNRGNSGGPLVNMDSEAIGIVAAVMVGEQNVGMAIPIDRVRQLFDVLLCSEVIHRKRVGLSLDPLLDQAVVAKVMDDSPAAKAGLKTGDQVLEIGDQKVSSNIECQLRLDGVLSKASKFPICVRRQAAEMMLEIQAVELTPRKAAAVENPKPGLKYQFYEGQFSRLPHFPSLSMVRDGVCGSLSELQSIHKGRQDFYAVVLNGYLRIDDEGLYRLILVSDDGSKLRLGDEWLIDNDGNHPPKAVGRLVRLGKGMHPIHVEYFQGNGDQQLRLFYEFVSSPATISLEPPKQFESGRFFYAE